MREEVEGMGVAVVTSADRLYADWSARDERPGGGLMSKSCWRRCRRMHRLSRLSTDIHWGCRGWAACAAIGSGPWASCALASAEIFPTFIGSIASTPTE